MNNKNILLTILEAKKSKAKPKALADLLPGQHLLSSWFFTSGGRKSFMRSLLQVLIPFMSDQPHDLMPS